MTTLNPAAIGRATCWFLVFASFWLGPELRADGLFQAGFTVVGTNIYPVTNKPVAGSQINWARSLSSNLVSALPLYEGSGTNFYDAVPQQSYQCKVLSGSPSGAMPPAWFTPAISANYPWGGPAISNNGATAQPIQSIYQESALITNVTIGYSYAILVQPLDTNTFGRIMDATGTAVITSYLNIPGKPGQVSTTWRDAGGGAINPYVSFAVNQWSLVLFTVQQGFGAMYVNGTLMASNTSVNLVQSWTNQIGPLCYNTTGGNAPGSQMCNANFSSFWVWNNRVLTAQEVAQMYTNPWAMFYSGAQKGVVKGTKVVLTNLAAVSNMVFYSHVAAGSVRLGLYDNETPKHLLWQSGVVSNTVAGGWLDVSVGTGAPATLVLLPGTYWLAWQVDTTYDVASYAAGTNGEGFYLSQPFGNFPTSLAGEQSSAETWSEYFDYGQPSPARFIGVTFQPGGSLQLQLNGSTNIPYALISSTNLASTNWLRLSSPAFNSNGLWYFSDTNAENGSQRYYRAVWP